MSSPDPDQFTADLVALEPDLAAHVIDLLDAAEIPADAISRGVDELVILTVPVADLERARATLNLVLPGLLSEEAGELLAPDGPPPLSGRLIRRSDWPSGAPEGQEPEQPEAGQSDRRGLSDGRHVFAAALEQDATSADTDGGYLDDGDFVPPVPEPLPQGDAVSRLAWLGAVGGPILMILAALVDLPSFAAGAGLAAFIIGFGVLVARMPDRARQDDGWDDGAVL